jgi:hypothetical protein
MNYTLAKTFTIDRFIAEYGDNYRYELADGEPIDMEPTVTEAVNDTLKAIAASLLMDQVLAPRFEFKPKHPLKDRFDMPVKPQEWFFVPLNVIEEVIEKIQAGTIDRFRYDLETASLTQLE